MARSGGLTPRAPVGSAATAQTQLREIPEAARVSVRVRIPLGTPRGLPDWQTLPFTVACYDPPKSVRALTVELEQEADGQWVAEVPELPGVLTPAA